MQRRWQVRRTVVACADAQQRWDHAYQLLLGWAAVPASQKEEEHACGILRPGVDRPAAAGPDDRAAGDTTA